MKGLAANSAHPRLQSTDSLHAEIALAVASAARRVDLRVRVLWEDGNIQRVKNNPKQNKRLLARGFQLLPVVFLHLHTTHNQAARAHFI